MTNVNDSNKPISTQPATAGPGPGPKGLTVPPGRNAAQKHNTPHRFPGRNADPSGRQANFGSKKHRPRTVSRAKSAPGQFGSKKQNPARFPGPKAPQANFGPKKTKPRAVSRAGPVGFAAIDRRSAREVLQSPAGLLEGDRALFSRLEHDPNATLRRAASKAGLPLVSVPRGDTYHALTRTSKQRWMRGLRSKSCGSVFVEMSTTS
jgi:hypothetical protein